MSAEASNMFPSLDASSDEADGGKAHQKICCPGSDSDSQWIGTLQIAIE